PLHASRDRSIANFAELHRISPSAPLFRFGISFAVCVARASAHEAEHRNRMFGLSKPKAVVGLDIGSSAVKAVELRPAGKGYKVAAFGIEPVPPDSIVDG